MRGAIVVFHFSISIDFFFHRAIPPEKKKAERGLSPLWQPTRLPRGGGRQPQQQQQPPLEQQQQPRRAAASSTWSRSRSLSKRREPHRPPRRRATSSSEPGPQRRSSSSSRLHSRPTTSSTALLAKGAGAEAGSPRRPTPLPPRDTTARCLGAPTGGAAGTTARAAEAPQRPSSKGLQTRGRRSWVAASKCSAARPCR